MTNLEQFKNDIAFNANHIQFSMADDEEMGQRGKGCYIKDIHKNGHECRNYIFDNGHHYVLDIEEQMIYVCEPILEEYFIHKFLEKAVSDFIDKWSIDVSLFYCLENEIEARSLIRLLPNREERIVYLTNILIPIELKHKGHGKLLIKQVFEVCKRFNYRLVLLNVMDSFSKSLKKRNAKFLEFDTIEITNETILS